MKLTLSIYNHYKSGIGSMSNIVSNSITRFQLCGQLSFHYLLMKQILGMKDDIKTLTVRFPEYLLEQMREVAKQNNRSLNGEILTAIEEHIKKQKKGK
jgi:predicted HicB family RNase H-like nuclease